MSTRREFITLLGGAAAAWPLAARAQQSERMPRIGVLVAPLESDREAQRWISVLREGLEKLGWNDGRNVRIDVRWGAGDAQRLRASAVELVGSKPDVIVAGGGSAVERLKQATQTIPVVFARSAIRSAVGSLQVWRGRVATSPALRFMSTASSRNGWNCSNSSRLDRSCGGPL